MRWKNRKTILQHIGYVAVPVHPFTLISIAIMKRTQRRKSEYTLPKHILDMSQTKKYCAKGMNLKTASRGRLHLTSDLSGYKLIQRVATGRTLTVSPIMSISVV